MTRGRQKIEAQQKNLAKKQANEKKGSQLDARAAALKAQCAICKCQVVNEKALKEHYEAKHPGKEIPKS